MYVQFRKTGINHSNECTKNEWFRSYLEIVQSGVNCKSLFIIVCESQTSAWQFYYLCGRYNWRAGESHHCSRLQNSLYYYSKIIRWKITGELETSLYCQCSHLQLEWFLCFWCRKTMNILKFNVFYFAWPGESKERSTTRHLLSSLEVPWSQFTPWAKASWKL